MCLRDIFIVDSSYTYCKRKPNPFYNKWLVKWPRWRDRRNKVGIKKFELQNLLSGICWFGNPLRVEWLADRTNPLKKDCREGWSISLLRKNGFTPNIKSTAKFLRYRVRENQKVNKFRYLGGGGDNGHRVMVYTRKPTRLHLGKWNRLIK